MARTRRRVAKPPRPAHAVSPRPFVGMGGIAAVFFLYAASGVIAPWWAVVVLIGVWVAFFVVACRWWTSNPDGLPWLPVIATGAWFVLLVGGALAFDWRA